MTEYLLSYGVAGIQSLIFENRWQPMIRGASELVGEFDRRCEKLPGKIFAGGGQGLLRTTKPEKVEQEIQAIAKTVMGSVARITIAKIQLGSEEFAIVYRRLRQKGEIAQEAGPAPIGKLPTRIGSDLCGNCRKRDPEEGTAFHEKEKVSVCDACCKRYYADPRRKEPKAERELGKLSDSNRLAMIVADGNEIGRFFSGVKSEEDLKKRSEQLRAVFKAANDAGIQAVSQSNRVLTSFVGGDDIQAFLDPMVALDFISALVESIHSEPLLKGHEGKYGISIGLIVASDHFPATQFAHYAHELLDQAKACCRSSDARSAVGVAFLTAGDEGKREGVLGDSFGYFDDENRGWKKLYRSATGLSQVSSSQRHQILTDLHVKNPAEIDNLFRYQVARSREWRDYIEHMDLDWTDSSQLKAEELVTPIAHDMARFLMSKKKEGV